jgi:hypothetical protein
MAITFKSKSSSTKKQETWLGADIFPTGSWIFYNFSQNNTFMGSATQKSALYSFCPLRCVAGW